MEKKSYENWLKEAMNFDDYYNKHSLFNFIRRKGLNFRHQTTIRLIGQNKNIVDIGCGTGRLAIELAKQRANVWGIDISKDALMIAKINAEKEGVSSRIQLLEGDIYTDFIPIPYADVWLALGLIEYMPNPYIVLKKMCHIPKFIFSVPISMSWEIPFRIVNRTLIKGIKFHTFNKRQIINLLNSVGYKNINFIPYFHAGYMVHNF